MARSFRNSTVALSTQRPKITSIGSSLPAQFYVSAAGSMFLEESLFQDYIPLLICDMVPGFLGIVDRPSLALQTALHIARSANRCVRLARNGGCHLSITGVRSNVLQPARFDSGSEITPAGLDIECLSMPPVNQHPMSIALQRLNSMLISDGPTSFVTVLLVIRQFIPAFLPKIPWWQPSLEERLQPLESRIIRGLGAMHTRFPSRA
ncbi:hypothetical protein B0H12DRAFT_54518 [Mycena haematopus]|nr:hypothetical protein B0H12DRAFT_54518 [Mycena haematopus]